ncbi:MAG: FitA-like ribbon-helix-helix domain-containing protein [Mycobacteriales bacterium]
MAAISVRHLDDQVKEQLRVRAANHGRSMESEIREILTDAVKGSDDLFTAILDRFSHIGGVNLDLPPRHTPARAADFSQ